RDQDAVLGKTTLTAAQQILKTFGFDITDQLGSNVSSEAHQAVVAVPVDPGILESVRAYRRAHPIRALIAGNLKANEVKPGFTTSERLANSEITKDEAGRHALTHDYLPILREALAQPHAADVALFVPHTEITYVAEAAAQRHFPSNFVVG